MIYFRQVNEPHGTKGAIWHVEFYEDTEGTMFPVGTAYVATVPGKPGHAQLSYMLVGDQWRRRGIMRELWAACKERWPALQATSPMDSKGKGFLKSVADDLEQMDED